MGNGDVWMWDSLADRVHGACLDSAVVGFPVRCGEGEVARVEVDSLLLFINTIGRYDDLDADLPDVQVGRGVVAFHMLLGRACHAPRATIWAKVNKPICLLR